MKKNICLILSLFLFGGTYVFAQGEIDAYNFSQRGLHGTARYVGMAGAFGALGGDVTSMTTNPAGLGIYRSSELVTTLSLSSVNTKTTWLGNALDNTKTNFAFDNIAYVGYFPTGNDYGIKGWNFGFSYNRLKNYNRTYSMTGRQEYSMADYVATITDGITQKDLQFVKDSYDPYYSSQLAGDWLSILGYEAGFIATEEGADNLYRSEFLDAEGRILSPESSSLRVAEKGAIDQYNFAFATNISDRVFLGATFVLTDLDYHKTTIYEDQFEGKDMLYLDNFLSTEGNGYAVNLGVIVRPVDFLRLGIAYNSSTWYKMTDYFKGEAGSYISDYADDPNVDASTPSNSYFEYELKTPDRWLFSLAGIFGQNALVSVDYELTNYKNMKLKDRDGYELSPNKDIKSDFKSSGVLRVGAEYKVTPQFSVRAGGAWMNSPLRDEFKNGLKEVMTAGTLPHYTIDKGVSHYTIGLGYRFTPQFYTDLACVYSTHKEDVYAFSNVFVDDVPVYSTPASMKTNTTRVSLTLGYKF